MNIKRLIYTFHNANDIETRLGAAILLRDHYDKYDSCFSIEFNNKELLDELNVYGITTEKLKQVIQVYIIGKAIKQAGVKF